MIFKSRIIIGSILIAIPAQMLEIKYYETYAYGASIQEKSNLIESLVSKNQPPKFALPRKAPLFPIDYDWNEYDRIAEALATLAEKLDDKLWIELIEHFDDDRYCTTASYNGAAYNFTIGEICQGFVLQNLSAAYFQHLTPQSIEIESKMRRLSIVNDKAKLKDWLAKHDGLPVYALQVKMCQNCIEELRKPNILPSVSLEIRRKWTALVEKQIQELLESKTSIRSSWFKKFEVYTANKAASLRKAYGKTP